LNIAWLAVGFILVALVSPGSGTAASLSAQSVERGLGAQPGADVVSSYRDPTARSLHDAAMGERARFNETVLDYTAVVRQRIGASLRMPLKDRTIYRSEAAHRL
jgi:hypothetical protein